MAEPILSFLYNTAVGTDTAYGGWGGANGTWRLMSTVTSSGTPDVLVFTGGGINAALATPTATFGLREATLRPIIGTLVIPQTYIESQDDNIMYNVPNAGKNDKIHVFGVYVDGEITSDLYLEAWDDNSFSTTTSPVLVGTASAPYSMINAIRYNSAYDTAPSASWHGTTYSGTERSANLKGYDNRVRLAGDDSTITDNLYYNMYLDLPYDAALFHGTPVISFRYLYI